MVSLGARRMTAPPLVLPFEKPVVELVTRVRELRELAKADEGLTPELRRLEDKAARVARAAYRLGWMAAQAPDVPTKTKSN